jgi:molecular chaperone GrpE
MNNRYREEEKEEKKEETPTPQDVKKEPEPKDVKAPKEKLKTEPVIPVIDPKIPALEAELAKAQEENKQLKNQYLRTLADADNFRKRVNEERLRERKYGSQYILEKMVAVIDIFDRAVNVKTDDEKLKQFLVGFEMVNNQLKQIMDDEGVKKINSLHQKFDPTTQHAVDLGYDDKFDDDTVIAESQTGYMYKDRVLRPALVIVNKKKQEENE